MNGGINESTKIAYFQWTLWDLVLVWGNNFMNKYPFFSLKELELNYIMPCIIVQILDDNYLDNEKLEKSQGWPLKQKVSKKH